MSHSKVREPGALQGFALVLPVMTIVMGSAVLAPNFPLILEAFQAQVPGRAAEYLVNAVLTLPALCIAIFSPLAGALADTFGRRKLMISAMLLYGVVGTIPLFVSDVWVILGSRALLGMAEAGILTCSTTLIGDYFSGRRRDHWLAMQATTASVSSIIMFPLGGFIGGTFGWNYPFAMYVISFVLVLLVIFFTWEPEKSQQLEGTKRFSWSKLTTAYVVGLAFSFGIMYLLKPLLPNMGNVELYALSIAALFGLSVLVMALLGKFAKPAQALNSATNPDFPWLRMAGIMAVVAVGSIMFYLLQIKLAQALGEMDLSGFMAPDMDGTIKAAIIIMLTSIGIPIGTIIFSRVSQTAISYLLAVEFALIAIGFFGMGWAPSVGTMMLFSFINQIGCGMTLPTMLTWTMRQLEFEQRGRGAGIFSAYQNGGQFVGPQLLTFLAGIYTLGAIKPAYTLIGYAAVLMLLASLIAIALGKGTQRIEYDHE